MTPVPESLKANKKVAPFIARASELASVNPVVSYYCKLYVIEQILAEQLHAADKEVESYTMSLLDETEALKLDQGEDSVAPILASRQLSISTVFVFAFKLFSGCLADLADYDGTNKPQLVAKIRATLTFWLLFSLFDEQGDPIDYGKLTGGRCTTAADFATFVKDKTKVLKVHLSKLLKDEVPIKGEDQEFQDLENAAATQTQDEPITKDIDETHEGFGEDSIHDSDTDRGAPADEDSGPNIHLEPPAEDDTQFSLPGAPTFDPTEGEAAFSLPGAPKFLPSDDLLQINKKSSIHMFKPGSPPPAREPAPQRTLLNVTHVTKELLGALVDTTEQIAKAQKHAKFAISALNYEDLATAEAELIKGLETIRLLQNQSS